MSKVSRITTQGLAPIALVLALAFSLGLVLVNSHGVFAEPAPKLCEDGIDNDNDGLIDLADPGCKNSNDNDEFDPITICHATGSGYVVNSPDATADAGGHAGESHQDGNDIIPPFDYDGGSFDGQNWDDDLGGYTGEDVWKNNCNVPETEPETGSITIDKVVTGAGADEDLDFTIDVSWSGDNVLISDNDTPVETADLDAGAYTITEVSIPANWAVTSIACTGEVVSEGASSGITLAEGEDVTCTVTNTYTAPQTPTGSLTIYKNTNDANNQVEFDFELDGNAFPDTILGNNADYETFPDLTEGAHTVTELDEADWTFGSVECVKQGDESWEDYDPGDSNVIVNIADGDNITCTFTNTLDEVDDTTITVIKQTDPDLDQTDFSFTLNASAFATLSDGESSGAVAVSAGINDLVEVDIPGWTLTNVSCVNEAQAAAGLVDADGVYLNLQEGDDIVCTFTNTEDSEEPQECSVTIVSDTTNTVNEQGDSNADAVTFIHGAWTAVISGASWIWGDDPVADPVATTTYTFKKTFAWNGPITSAVLDVASDNSYTALLNGLPIGSDPAENNHAAGTQDQHNAAAPVITGTNTLEITVTNWQQDGGTTESNPAGLLYKLVVTGTDEDCDNPPDEEPNECIPGVNIAANGGFELPDVTNGAGWDIFPSGTLGLEWIVEWMGAFVGAPATANAELHGGVLGWLPDEGEQYAELDTDWGGPSSGQTGEEASVSLEQTVPTVGGEEYTLSFAFSPRPGTGTTENEIEVLWDGVVIDTIDADGTANGNTVWTTHTYANLSAADATTDLEFRDLGDPNSLGSFLDDVSVMCEEDDTKEDPGLTLEKSGIFDSASGTITFTIDWAVTGDGSLANVTITDPVPAGTTFVSADNGGTESLGTVTWLLGTQPGGATGTVSFIVALDEVATGTLYAVSFDDVDQGTRKNGTAVLAARSDANDALGAPQSTGINPDPALGDIFFSLGFKSSTTTPGGSIVLEFPEAVMNGAGDDINVFEITGNTNPPYPVEAVQVEAWDGVAWVNLGLATRDDGVDLGSLPGTIKVRLTDMSNPTLFEPTADAYDLDAVQGLYEVSDVCSIANEATITGTLNGEGVLNELLVLLDGIATSTTASTTVIIDREECNPPGDDDDDDDDDDSSITIVKNVVGESEQSFDFDASWLGQDVDFSLSDGQSTTSESLPAGIYEVEEGALAGWVVEDVVCIPEGVLSHDEGEGDIEINLGENQDVTCTFTNAPRGTVIVEKIVINDSNTGQATTSDFTLSFGNGSATTTVVSGVATSSAPGAYTVVESGPGGYTATFGGDCAPSGNITVSQGATTTCTITNDDIPREPETTEVSGMKWNDLDGDGDKDPGEPGIQGWTISISDDESFATTTVTDGNGNYSFFNLDPDTYFLCEILQGGWNQTYPSGNELCQGSAGHQTSPSVGEPSTGLDFGNHEENQCTVTVISDTITTVDEQGNSNADLVSFIHPAWTALINGASWIWGDDPVADPAATTTYTFTRTFTWSGPVIGATLEIATDNTYSVTLNGSGVGTSTDGNNFELGTQDAYDVTGSIIQGTNEVKFTVENWGVPGEENPEANPAGLMYRVFAAGSDPECDLPPSSGDDDDDDDDDDDGGGGGGSSRRSSGDDDDDDGEVLGEQTSILPFGAPATGFGGMSRNSCEL